MRMPSFEFRLPRSLCSIWRIAVFLMAAPVLSAALSPSALFSDHMILQRDRPVPVWGTATPGEKIAVYFGGQFHRVKTDPQGNWQVRLKPMPPSFEPRELVIKNLTTPGEKITIRDVLVGEVWIAAGQSNMAYGVSSASKADAEIAAANYPAIRVFQMETRVAGEPQRTVTGLWKVCSPKSVGDFSATGYFFARDLYQALNVPVGLLQNAESGTLAEAWMSKEALESDADFQPILDRYQNEVTAYQALVASGDASKTNSPDSTDPNTRITRPSGLYNGKLNPLIPYAIRGVIWWQGEYNSERGEQYRKLFPALIRDWRARWKSPNLPFLFVQLQNLDIQPQPNPAHYDELREAQLMTHRSVPHTGMAVACDVGDPKDIHPPNKQPVGQRLALLARNLVYGEKDLVSSGPLFRKFKITNSNIEITFDHTGSGLVLKTGTALSGFEIAGKDRVFNRALVELKKNKLIVSSPKVPKPIAVRYAWLDNPLCTLFNVEGLPASPFRTDDWPVHSTGKR